LHCACDIFAEDIKGMKITFLILGLFLYILTLAQVEIKCLSLSDPDLNIFYSPVDNKVKIVGVKVDSSLELTSETGEVHRFYAKEKSEFVLKYNRAKTDTLRILKDGEIILKKGYEVRYLPDPKVSLGSIKGNSASVSEILEDPTIHIVLEDCYWKETYSFRNYDMIILDTSDLIFFSADDIPGNKISKKYQKTIKGLEPGYTLIIKNIIAYCSSCAGRVMRPLSITIK